LSVDNSIYYILLHGNPETGDNLCVCQSLVRLGMFSIHFYYDTQIRIVTDNFPRTK